MRLLVPFRGGSCIDMRGWTPPERLAPQPSPPCACAKAITVRAARRCRDSVASHVVPGGAAAWRHGAKPRPILAQPYDLGLRYLRRRWRGAQQLSGHRMDAQAGVPVTVGPSLHWAVCICWALKKWARTRRESRRCACCRQGHRGNGACCPRHQATITRMLMHAIQAIEDERKSWNGAGMWARAYMVWGSVGCGITAGAL